MLILIFRRKCCFQIFDLGFLNSYLVFFTIKFLIYVINQWNDFPWLLIPLAVLNFDPQHIESCFCCLLTFFLTHTRKKCHFNSCKDNKTQNIILVFYLHTHSPVLFSNLYFGWHSHANESMSSLKTQKALDWHSRICPSTRHGLVQSDSAVAPLLAVVVSWGHVLHSDSCCSWSM